MVPPVGVDLSPLTTVLTVTLIDSK